MTVVNLQLLIDAAVHNAAEDEYRRHLGGSMIGGICDRALYYSFRWASPSNFDGRVLRLFNRGHEEEPRFIRWLGMIGVQVEEYDPATVPTLWWHPESESYVVGMPNDPQHHNMELVDVSDVVWRVEHAKSRGIEIPKPRQYGFTAINNHYGGSLDGKAWGVPFLEQFGLNTSTKILVEFKTHGDKSFNELVAKKMAESKPVHKAQMVQYMDQKQLPLGLYCAVNKNTDALYFEFVSPNPGMALQLMAKADRIVNAAKIPDRISRYPTWKDCQWCDHRAICHFGAPMVLSCRTCRMSKPVEDGRWHCSRWGKLIPEDFERKGCSEWNPVHD